EDAAGRRTKNLEELSTVSNWRIKRNPKRELTNAAAPDLRRVWRAASHLIQPQILSNDWGPPHYELRNQTRSYWELQDYVLPESINQARMWRLREQVAREHPDDFVTQLYVLDQRVSEI